MFNHMGAWSGSYIKNGYTKPKNMTVTVPESLAKNLGMDAYDITFLLGCITEDSSESVEKQLRNLILTLKLEYGDKLADKKAEIERNRKQNKAQLEQMQQEQQEINKQLRDAEQDWYERCWDLAKRLDNGEKIKLNRNSEVHMALLHANIIQCRVFSNRLKLTKPFTQTSMVGVRDSELMMQLRHQKKRVYGMHDFIFRIDGHGHYIF
jgi:hypothetical protein